MKTLNVFGIIFAWILSIAMVIMLIAAPLTLSALSVLEAENIMELVGEAMVKKDASTAAPQKGYSVEMLSAKSNVQEENAPTNNALDGMVDSVQDIIGEELDPEVLNKILNSDLAEDLLDAYMGDVANAVTGNTGKNQFTAEKVAEVMEDNLDEILELVEESGLKLTDDQKEQLKGEIRKTVEENAEEIAQEIVKAVPAPEEILESNEVIKALAALMAKKDQIKLIIVGVIVLLSLLIFALRYPRFRGLRWLYTNLFTAGGFNVVICLILGFGASAVKGIAAGVNAIDGTAVDGIIGTLLSQLTTGVIVRTVIIFVAAVALLVGYILLKMFVRKKKAKKAELVAEEVISTPVLEPTPVSEAVPAAPVYTSVTVEPELATEPAAEPDTENTPAEVENE